MCTDNTVSVIVMHNSDSDAEGVHTTRAATNDYFHRQHVVLTRWLLIVWSVNHQNIFITLSAR